MIELWFNVNREKRFGAKMPMNSILTTFCRRMLKIVIRLRIFHLAVVRETVSVSIIRVTAVSRSKKVASNCWIKMVNHRILKVICGMISVSSRQKLNSGENGFFRRYPSHLTTNRTQFIFNFI